MNVKTACVLGVMAAACAEKQDNPSPADLRLATTMRLPVLEVAAHDPIRDPAWNGVVLVRPNGKLGFFLSRYDDINEEHIITEDQVILDVVGERRGGVVVYKVPVGFNSTVSDIKVGKKEIMGVGEFDYCRFAQKAKPLPWNPESIELKGKLFLIPIVDETVLTTEVCVRSLAKNKRSIRQKL